MSGIQGREWAPGAAVVAGAILFALLVGGAFGSRSIPVYAGLAAGAVLVTGWAERWWIHRAAVRALGAPLRRKKRSGLRVIRGGRDDVPPDFDLENDESTRKQRWLM
jgi:hypothetical protein